MGARGCRNWRLPGTASSPPEDSQGRKENASWRQSHGDLRRPRNNPRNPIIFYCDSTPTFHALPALPARAALRTAGATKTNERRRLGDEIRISRYNWKLPPPTSRSLPLLALLFSIPFRFLQNVFPSFSLSLDEAITANDRRDARRRCTNCPSLLRRLKQLDESERNAKL